MADRVAVLRLLASIGFALSVYALWPDAPPSTAGPEIVIVPGTPPILPLTATSQPLVPGETPVPASATTGLSVLETATADDTGPGSATVRDATGLVRRLVVGSRLDSVTALIAVADGGATFSAPGGAITLPIAARPPAALGYSAARHRD